MTDQAHPLSPQDCLIAVMIAVTASDDTIRTAELVSIEAMVNNLPVFANYDMDRIKSVSRLHPLFHSCIVHCLLRRTNQRLLPLHVLHQQPGQLLHLLSC